MASDEDTVGDMDGDEDWQALAVAVRRARQELGYRQADLEAHGGPGQGTVKNVEQAARTKYAPRTFTQLDTALEWPRGTSQKIIRRQATSGLFTKDASGRLTRVDASETVAPRTVAGSASADLGGLQAGVGRPAPLQEAANLFNWLAVQPALSPAGEAALSALRDLVPELAADLIRPRDT